MRHILVARRSRSPRRAAMGTKQRSFLTVKNRDAYPTATNWMRFLFHYGIIPRVIPMPQLEHIEAIEKRLWNAADTLRANSNYASNEYFLPVMGLIFLRHAYSRYLAVRDSIVAGLPTRGGKPRELTKQDFSQAECLSSPRILSKTCTPIRPNPTRNYWMNLSKRLRSSVTFSLPATRRSMPLFKTKDSRATLQFWQPRKRQTITTNRASALR